MLKLRLRQISQCCVYLTWLCYVQRTDARHQASSRRTMVPKPGSALHTSHQKENRSPSPSLQPRRVGRSEPGVAASSSRQSMSSLVAKNTDDTRSNHSVVNGNGAGMPPPKAPPRK